jgi:hypothetical protein
MRNIRDGGRRAIPWDDQSAIDLDRGRRRVVGNSWLARMKQEHLAVGAFSLLAQELARVGCEPVVLALITRAAADEVRHADVCKRLAQGLLGIDAVPSRFKGVPKVPQHEQAPARDCALLHVVEMCCINETNTGVFLTEMFNRASQTTARAAVESLLEDEIDHGHVGWAHLTACCREGWGQRVLHEALPALLSRTLGPVFNVARRHPEKDDREMEAHGYLGRNTAAALHADTLKNVLLPGFESFGIDTTEARALARSERWLEQ